MPHHPVYGLDIETGHATGGSHGHEAGDPGVPADTGEVPATDPHSTVVTRVVVSTAMGDQTFHGDEATLLGDLDATLAGLEPGILATWNGSGFDLPYLADRAGIRGIRLGLHLAADRRLRYRGATLPGHRYSYRAAWYEHRHLDAAHLYRSGRRPLIEVDELIRAIRRTGRGRSTTATGSVFSPRDELTHDAAHAFASNDAKLVRSMVEARLPGAARYVDRITVPDPIANHAAAPAAPATPRRTSRGGVPFSAAHPAVRAALAANRT